MSMYLVFALSFLMTFLETKNFKIVRDGEMKHIFSCKGAALEVLWSLVTQTKFTM